MIPAHFIVVEVGGREVALIQSLVVWFSGLKCETMARVDSRRGLLVAAGLVIDFCIWAINPNVGEAKEFE